MECNIHYILYWVYVPYGFQQFTCFFYLKLPGRRANVSQWDVKPFLNPESANWLTIGRSPHTCLAPTVVCFQDHKMLLKIKCCDVCLNGKQMKLFDFKRRIDYAWERKLKTNGSKQVIRFWPDKLNVALFLIECALWGGWWMGYLLTLLGTRVKGAPLCAWHHLRSLTYLTSCFVLWNREQPWLSLQLRD